MLSIILLIMFMLTIHKWFPPLALIVGGLLIFPAIPYIIAYNIKDEKPNQAMALRVIWSIFFALVGLILLIS